MKLCLVGEGAIADTHMRVLSDLPEATVATLVGGVPEDTRAFAATWSIPAVAPDLAAALADDTLDGVILASPSGLHAVQARACVAAGKSVLVEIPMGVSLAEAEAVAALDRDGGPVVMICHSRRFSPAHRWLRDRIRAGAFDLQHLVCETLFFRRTNTNMLGRSRSWVDHLLWHHACHTVDLFLWATGQPIDRVAAQQGPPHPELGIAMDMTIGLATPTGALLSLVLSFNNRGPFGGFYRYIGVQDTYHVFRDGLEDGERKAVPLSGGAFADQDAEFVAAIRDRRRPEASARDCLPAMAVLDRIDRCLVASAAGPA